MQQFALLVLLALFYSKHILVLNDNTAIKATDVMLLNIACFDRIMHLIYIHDNLQSLDHNKYKNNKNSCKEKQNKLKSVLQKRINNDLVYFRLNKNIKIIQSAIAFSFRTSKNSCEHELLLFIQINTIRLLMEQLASGSRIRSLDQRSAQHEFDPTATKANPASWSLLLYQ